MKENMCLISADITHLIAKDKTVLGKGGHVLSDGLKKEETSPLHREKNISSGKDVYVIMYMFKREKPPKPLLRPI